MLNLRDPELSIAQARAIVHDLFVPTEWIYWTDFLLSAAAGYGGFLAARKLPLPRWAEACCFAVSCLGIYRAVLFTHELTHLRAGTFRRFRLAWNALIGIPFLTPSFLYHTHVAHHIRRHYGTRDDGEYLPLAGGPRRRIIAFLALSFVMPPLAIFRFLVLSPLSWLSPRIRHAVHRRASSLVIDPSYIRPLPSRSTLAVWRLQEAACLGSLVMLGTGLATGITPLSFIPCAYLVAVAVIMLNAVRTLAAHHYRHQGEEVNFTEQLLDSINYPGRPLLSELWAPVGLRFHALHHLFPTLPYHNLAKAHRRLMAQLPTDSPYRKTNSTGLIASLRELWSAAGREPHQRRAAA